jgi:hypothetical protein
VLPDGHEDDAVVVVIVGAAVGGAVAFGAEAVGVEAELELPLGVELPQAARAAAATASVARGIQCELLRVTCDASVIRVSGLSLPLVHYEASRFAFEEAVTMSDHSDPLIGTQGSMENPESHLTGTPHGGGWRMFAEPVEVEAFLGQIWVPVLVDGFDSESAEIWARWPPVETHPSEDIHHQVIDASHYRAPKDGFPPG